MKISIKFLYQALLITAFSTVLMYTAGMNAHTKENPKEIYNYNHIDSSSNSYTDVNEVININIGENTLDTKTDMQDNDINTDGVSLEETRMILDEDKSEEIIDEFKPYDMYVSTRCLRVRSSPDKSDNTNIIGVLNLGELVTIVDEAEDEWVIINYNGEDAYISSEYIQEEKLEKNINNRSEYIQKLNLERDTSINPEYIQKLNLEEDTYNDEWMGKKLNSYDGKVAGPSGNETYYNLNMSKCVYYMNCLGYYGNIWTRSDGAKMFDKYVMVAADLSIRPKGTLVETTLGTGIVVDTGEFAEYDSTRLDIATTW